MTSRLLSKTKYLNGLQCPKYLWMLTHQPEEVPEPDAATKYAFSQGHMVGRLAKKLYPTGVDIPTEHFMRNTWQTQELLHQRVPLFEAGILAEDIYARVDILNPVGEDEWDIVEVKSSTSAKDVHRHDISFQKHCCQKAGLKIRKCLLMYINNRYIKHGEIDPNSFFSIEDTTAAAEELSAGIQERINTMFAIVAGGECPNISIGRQCNDPYQCPVASCWDFLPEHNVLELYRGGHDSFDLLESGILAIADIPDSFPLTEKQEIQRSCVVGREPYVNKKEIQHFLTSLQYPLYYLDFETFGPAVPLFDGTRPYQAIPFQFSLHVVRDAASCPEHFSFLTQGVEDPRPELLFELKRVLGNPGSIVVYNQTFEDGVFQELAQAWPDHGEWIDNVRGRLVDLIMPFRSFYYYHPKQRGGMGLKQVLPALTGISYEGMEIHNGQDASIVFQQVTYSDADEEQRSKVRENLRRYCGLDTEGMLRIVGKLREVVGLRPERPFSQLNFDW